jgi:hypothetical protein
MTAKRPTVAALAIELGVTRQSLYDWHAQGCPVHAGCEAIRRWHRNNKRMTPRNRTMRRSKLLDSSPPDSWEEFCEVEALLFSLLEARRDNELTNLPPAEAAALLAETHAWLADVFDLAKRRLPPQEDTYARD